MENLYSPIIFFDADPTSEKTKDGTCPAIPQGADNETDYKPSFCDLSDFPFPAEEPSQLCVSAPFEPGLLGGVTHSFYSQTRSAPATQPEKPKQAQPRPYNVAVELMATQPLRMVDNALYAFDGQVYRFVDAPNMNRLIMHLCRAYVHTVGDASIIDRIYKVVQAEPSIVYNPGSEAVPFVAMDDGLLNLMDFSIGPYDSQLFVTVKLHGSYSRGQTSSCPVFDSFLHNISGGDSTLIERIWQAIGYALVPDTNGKCFILLQGVPDSGKSLLGDVIASLVDQELVTSLDIGAMGERFGASELVGKHLCLSLDMPSGALDAKSVSTFKSLTGGDVVTVDVKYQPRIKLRCKATFVVATNHALMTRDYDPAFLQRAVTIPFRFSVEKGQQDHSLKSRILAERDAIIYRAIQAYARLRQANYQFVGNYEANEVTFGSGKANLDLNDALWNFCRISCVEAPGNFVATSTLHTAFCKSTDIPYPGGARRFSAEIETPLLELFGTAVYRDRKRPGGSRNAERGFVGISLRTKEGDPDA